MSDQESVKVLTCAGCGAPVVAGTPACPSCGVPVTDNALPFMLKQEARPEVGPLFKWWGIWSLAIWALSGFDLGTTSSLILAGVSIFFLLKILRTHFAEP